MKDKLDLIEQYAQERVQEALASAAGRMSRARMCRDNAREILKELCSKLGITPDDYWRGE